MLAVRILATMSLIAACDKSSPTFPTTGEVACRADAVAHSRKRADGFVKAGDLAAARTELERPTCTFIRDDNDDRREQLMRRLLDLVVLLEKTGAFAECNRVLGQYVMPGRYLDGPPEVIEQYGRIKARCEQAASVPSTGAGSGALADAGIDAPPVDAAPIACTAAAIGQARKEAEAHVKAGRYDQAIALLQGDTCYLEMDQPDALKLQIAWRLSDLAFAYYKAGQFGNCYGIAAAETQPYAGNVGFFFGESDGVMKALEYNADLCQDAAAKERGKFEPGSDTKCTLAKEAIDVPASALDGTDKAACLVIAPGKKGDEDMNECGDVTLVRQSKKGRISKTKLEVTTGNLADGSVCCNLEGVSFGRHGANLAILVETMGKDCNGGTASSEEQHAYELVGTKLELFHTLNATAH